MNRRSAARALACVVALVVSLPALATSKRVTVTVNQLEIVIDEATGGVVSMRSPHTGELLSAVPQQAGMLDVAYPTELFAPMRLASRFSSARIARAANGLTITWDKLGPSRDNLPLAEGAVRAQVTIQAAPDGRSVIFQARIQNDSALPVPQILFPDLAGLRPFAGTEATRLRLARDVVYPFSGPVTDPGDAPFYAMRNPPHLSGIAWKDYRAGGYYQVNSLRWLDFGSYNGGLSIFQKKWGSFDWPNVLTRRSEADPTSLRMVWEHKAEIAPGTSWQSGEFWFTPHPGGWAKGIEVYRDYVAQVTPQHPLPDHVREGIGAQTIWMIQTAEVDPAKAAFRFADLPRVAADAHRYGIRELIPWGWCTYSTMPIPIREELGTVDDFIRGVREARNIGVNVTPFISIAIVRNMYAERYGAQPGNADWTYHDELVPMFRPYYTRFWNGVEINANNELWQSDVVGALSQWIDRGVTSFSWDVFRVPAHQQGLRPPTLQVVDTVRQLARAADPQSVFSGESVDHLELDSESLDYLWNWTAYEDAGPITSVLRAPRISCNVEGSALVVAKCFADNLYLNVMPRHPDTPNGTALISDKPELAQAVLRAAQLRKQFLPYFVDGIFLGDSVLTVPSNGFVRGYRLGERLLVIALNDTQGPSTLTLRTDLDLWLPRSSRYEVTQYDVTGSRRSSSSATSTKWAASTPLLESGEMMLFEIVAN